ncbi:hypothetical protein CCR75_002861 [Bremia lactucae]|uniref:Uncharacterized protein n=1 Tax=Bremia lactucae TaxID=4779 RepID=A0A976IET1_BRELC|nr:hypothetical protein CCR75_002861 [Bremia lactucae]
MTTELFRAQLTKQLARFCVRLYSQMPVPDFIMKSSTLTFWLQNLYRGRCAFCVHNKCQFQDRHQAGDTSNTFTMPRRLNGRERANFCLVCSSPFLDDAHKERS